MKAFGQASIATALEVGDPLAHVLDPERYLDIGVWLRQLRSGTLGHSPLCGRVRQRRGILRWRLAGIASRLRGKARC